MKLNHEQLRILGEASIARARPGGSVVAAYGLVMAGMVVIAMSPSFLLPGLAIEYLTGSAVGRPFLWVGVGVVGVGAGCFVVAWGLGRGLLWGWFGAQSLTVLSLALAWWISPEGSPVQRSLAAVLVADHLAIQLLLWSSPVRGWFLESHRVRARRYEGMDVELREGR